MPIPASDPLEFVAMYILGTLPKTSNGNQFVILMIVSYSKLTRVVPESKKTASHAALTVIDNGDYALWYFQLPLNR